MAARPAGAAIASGITIMAEHNTPLDANVAQTLSSLANLIDDRIRVRGVRGGLPLAARHLGVPESRVVTARLEPSPLAFTLACRALGRDIGEHPQAQVRSADDGDAPAWVRFDLAGGSELIPGELAVDFPARTVADVPLSVEVGEDYSDPFVLVRADRDAQQQAQDYLDGLVKRAQGRDNPFRGRVVAASMSNRGLLLKVVPRPEETRERVVLPERVWRAVDVNVHGLFAQQAVLDRAGLPSNRGILLGGPPGTGKTAITRVLAREVPENVTVVFCDAKILHNVDDLYDEVAHLAPALVVMEDLDLVVRHRHYGGDTDGLQRFLVALDGMLTRHRGVVTVATTNDPNGIDPAARRACRFDVVVEVNLPDAAARRIILETYLRPLGIGGDLGRLVAATDGLSGAELQELARTAVLVAQGVPTVDDLLALAAERGAELQAVGQYL